MTTAARRYRDRISQDPQVMVGKPVVKDTRIPVELVLAKLAQNPSLDELFTDYPRLTLEDVKACLDYASALTPALSPGFPLARE
jgi:uncharacterized protein (DUF433 family)